MRLFSEFGSLRGGLKWWYIECITKLASDGMIGWTSMMNCKNDDSSLLSTVLLYQWLEPLSSDLDRLTLVMKALWSFTTSETNPVTQRHISEHLTLQQHRCENLKSLDWKKWAQKSTKLLSRPSVKGKVKAVCGSYSTDALRHIVLLPEWVPSFISRGAEHTKQRERPLLAKEGTIPGI